MAVPTEKLGVVLDAGTEQVDGERAQRYADATNDDNPRYASGECIPPVYAVVPTWSAIGLAAAEVLPAEFAMMIVHGEQDMHFHRPLEAGMTIATTAAPLSIRVGSSGTRMTVRTESVGDDGDPVLEQYVTMFVRGMTDGDDGGPDKPGHDFPEGARAASRCEYAVHVDDDQTFRYSDASGDLMPIHLDADFAKGVGLPGIIAHGLCTMAMCCQAVVNTAADGDPRRLRRLAVRFAKNVFPGNDVVTHMYDSGGPDGRTAVAFEATSAGDLVIKNGLAEIA